ncbi:MAG: hypothetical protein MRZ40_07590 [Ligilactobacillus animalis]|uniref:hypothetical protein n=1 Tax=Ligilactobacillus animalis TaxID=1605 RepID=UPI00243220A9|nr:hypothetical protein [Ligilactobacillus animalis]MCI5942421.1 hypothetical protein [Ligilactobacillus animalis]
MERKTTWELLGVYMDHFGERLPIAQMCVTDSELREILIKALLENKKYKLNIPKGCIV